MNEKMYVYDNTISARTYVSYIAEQAGGFALIGRDGKLYIRTIGESTAELPLKYFQNYKWGEKFKVSRVRYEDGVQVFEKGDETNNTVYINQENMYISKQAQIDSIYDKLNNLEVYSFEGNSIIDPALDIGDILIIDGKKVLYQGSSQYGGKFKANISSKIHGKAKEVTTVRVPSQKTINRRVESRINEAEGKITQLVEETSEFDGKITKVEQTVDSITQKVESMEEFSREISSMQQLHLSNTAEGENLVLDLSIYGDTEKFKVLMPAEDLVPSEDLVPYGDKIDLIVDTQPRSNPSENAQKFEIAIGEPLRNIGQVRDELNIINNKVSITRRIKEVYAKSTDIFERRRVNSNGTLSSVQDNYLLSDYIKVERLKQYDISFDYNENDRFNFYQIAYYDENKNYLNQESITGTNATITTIQSAKYVRVGLRYLEEWAVDGIPNNFQLIEHGRTNRELYVLDKEIIEELEDIKIPTYKDNTYIYIREYLTLEYFCRYIVDNDYIDTFLPKVEFGTELIQNVEAFKFAWNHLSQYIKMEGLEGNATLNIYDKKNNILMSIDDKGQNFYGEHGDKSFGKTGVSEVIDEYDNTTNAKYVAFSVKGDYGEKIKNGMAWGITTESDNKFYPILYIKDFTIPPKNSGGCTGQLVLDGCDLALGSENSGIVSNGLRITADAIPGVYFIDENTNTNLLSVIPAFAEKSARISLLDKIEFYENQSGSNTLKVGNDTEYCLLTDDGYISAKNIHSNEKISCKTLESYGHIYCNNGVQPFSLAEKKKNIEKYNKSALNEINNTDIYYYNYKEDEEKCKKRIGAIIGKDYNCSNEIIGKEGKGIDLYSMISLSFKAVQELYQKVEQLEKIIKENTCKFM